MFDKYCRITIKIEIDEQILAPRSTRYSRRVLLCPRPNHVNLCVILFARKLTLSCVNPRSEIYGKKNYNGIMHTEDSPEGPPGGPGTGGNVIIHHVPEESKSRWSHIEDLDSFFKKVYEYHQRHGFTVMMLQVYH